MTKRDRILFLLVALGPAAPAASAFDCAKAGTAVEKTICANPDLKALDDRLGPLYKRAVDATPDTVTVRNVQKNWLTDRNACGTDRDCIEMRYQERLGQLDDYVAALDDADTGFVGKATADKTCIRYVPADAPNVQVSCQVLDWSPMGEIGGFTRVAAVYGVSYAWNGQERAYRVPALLTWNPDDSSQLALDYLMASLAEPDASRPATELRPRHVHDAKGDVLEYRFQSLDGRPDVRRYRLENGIWVAR